MKGKLFKKATALLSAAAMLLTYADFSAIDFSVKAGENGDEPMLSNYDLNGDGDYDDVGECGWGYELDSADDLYWFADMVINNGKRNLNAFLTKDITINSDVLINGELNTDGEFKEWTPVGNNDSNSFFGTFEGGGHTISGLYINSPEENAGNRVGLFGYNNGTIKNVCIADSYIYGYCNVGSICGINNSNGTIENCCNSGVVKSINSICGGICGKNSSTITNCFNTGEVDGLDDVGSICGVCDENVITNCYYLKTEGLNVNLTGKGNGDDVSGLIEAKSAGQFASGEVCWLLNSGETQAETPAFYQTIGKDEIPVFDSNHKKVFKKLACDGVSDYYSNEDKNQEHSYENGICTTCDGYEPAEAVADEHDIDDDNHTDDDVFEISNAGQLYWFAGLVNGKLAGVEQRTGANAYLTNDITVNSSVLDEYGELNENDKENFRTWTPIGYYDSENKKSYSYCGTFDGAGHTISGLYFNDSSVKNVGLFGYAGGGSENKIKNLTVADSYFCGKEQVGGVCGVNNCAKIHNCSNTGTVKGGSYVGGVCGKSICSGSKPVVLIKNCYNTGKVSGNSTIGGVCGYNEYKSTIQNCYNTGTVTGTTIVGGICGQATHTLLTATAPIMIENCYNKGTISGDTYVGSICGACDKNVITNCYYLKTNGLNVNLTGKGNGADVSGLIEAKSDGQFTSGEVCYILNGGETQAETPAFFQNIGEDESPVLDGNHSRVYLATNCVTYSNTDGNKNHALSSFAKVKATCTKSGRKAYWYCKDCGKYFSDAGCTNVIDDIEKWKSQDGKLRATGHSKTKIPQVNATCTTDGSKAYWYCQNCNNYYSDEDCTEVIYDIEKWKSQDGKLGATGHNYKDEICEYCGAFEDGIGARLAGCSVSLDGSIGVNFYMELSDAVTSDENAYLLVTYPNGSDDKMLIRDRQPVSMNGRSYYVFQCKVAATEMADTITAQIMTSSGDGKKYRYSVKDYADYLLAHTDDNAEYKKAEELVRAMLNYGAYAQSFKEYNTDNLPCGLSDVSGYEIKEHGYTASTGDKVKFAGANLSMLSNTTLRLFFKADDITGVTFAKGAGALETGENKGLYFVEITNISPDMLDKDVTVSINDNGKEYYVTYSPIAYCYQVSQNSSDTSFVNLVKAIAKYNDAAKAYLGKE